MSRNDHLIPITEADADWLFDHHSKHVLYVFVGNRTYLDPDEFPEAAAALKARQTS